MFREYYLNSDVLSLAFYSKYILAGIGNDLFIYNNENLVMRIKIFIDERIHNMQVSQNTIVIKGCRQMSLVKLLEEGHKLTYEILCKLKCKDWIQDFFYNARQNELVLATAHNMALVWSTQLKSYINLYSCEEKCLLYCCKFLGTHAENFVLFCGTASGEVFIWGSSPSTRKDQPVLHRLSGHSGVVFSVEVNPHEKIICTTSYDRSVRIWSVVADGSILERKTWDKAQISLTHTLYGHTARVWKSLLLSDFVVSGGEDSKLCFWDKMGKLVERVAVHQESGIRGLSYWSDKKSILSGGEDGGIQMLFLDRVKNKTQSAGFYSLNENDFGLPRKVFALEGLICTTDRGCVIAAENQALCKKIYEDEEFRTYCLLEISACNRYIMLGSIKGRILIIEAKSQTVCFNENVMQGRIYSLHWLRNYVVMCGSEGLLIVYKINLFARTVLKLQKILLLPKSKERWTTCALVHNDYLFVGDRLGSLHIYSMANTQQLPETTFFKIHGHLGLTDIVKYGDAILTAGRDGTVKKFCFDEGKIVCCLKYKLPMDWPWKIVEYKNEIYILGFRSVDLVVWNLQKREIIYKYDCGGGHRSCDFKITDDNLKFFYISKRQVLFVEFPLSSTIHIRSGFHGKEINCFKIINVDPVIAISGDEGNTLRISRITKNCMEELYVLENHISSVRDVNLISIKDTETLFFSAGGRAQISAHKFDIKTLNYTEIENSFLIRRDKKNNAPSLDGETRIMGLDSIAFGSNIFISAGCSDRKIRIFSYKQSLTELTSIPYSHCILKVRLIELNSNLLLLSMGTDGYAVFWNITDPTSRSDKIDSIQIHQSGINSFELKHLGDGKFLLATGGDDNLLSVILLQLHVDKKVDILGKWQTSDAHACQITGIKFLENVFLTTSVDQRLFVWSYKLEGNTVSVEMIKQYLSIVGDIQGIDVAQNTSGSALVCLFGKGMEIIEMDLSEKSDNFLLMDIYRGYVDEYEILFLKLELPQTIFKVNRTSCRMALSNKN